jgi:hypothetical protein
VTTGPAQLSRSTNNRGRPELEFGNSDWRLRVEVGERLDPYELLHLGSGRFVADESYCYQLAVAGTTNSGYHGGRLDCLNVSPVGWSLEEDGGATTLVLTGQLDFGRAGPTSARLEHRFTLSPGGRFVERISIAHHRGRDRLQIVSPRFGFRKTLFDRSSSSWRDGADGGQLVPVPLRRHAGQGTDHLVGGYTAADLFPDEWTRRRSMPRRSAEAWLWTDGDGGFLVAKYNQDHIEFSVADGDYVKPRRGAEEYADLQLDFLHSDRNLCLRFGGAGLSRGCPEHADALEPGRRIDFGPSIVEVFEGDWQAGFRTYKELLKDNGHIIPRDYDPQVHWNELYRLGWRCGSNAPLQELPELWREAQRAQAAGAQRFYFDPGWDLFEGSAVWDTDRLGPVEQFVAKLRADYGLDLALHLMMHTKSLEEDPAIYRRRADGTIALWVDNTPYVGGYVCPASPTWKRQKTDRLRTLASAGVLFFMFDFLSYQPGGFEPIDGERSAVESCWSAEHGHRVPLTREEHAEGIMTVVRAIKSEFPAVTIEAHDRIAGEFLPLYYQHATTGTHDELWGFEYMWDPYTDLLSGKALSLYEYNLAYDIPLYLHINSAHDSPTMLAFWWYASCCRHLGIGGLDEADEQWPRLVEAMQIYRRLQPWFGRGQFVGVDRLTHLHVLEDRRSAVLTAYNLSARELRRSVNIDLSVLGLDAAPEVASYPATAAAQSRVHDGSLVVDVTVAPLSPVVVELGTRNA